MADQSRAGWAEVRDRLIGDIERQFTDDNSFGLGDEEAAVRFALDYLHDLSIEQLMEVVGMDPKEYVRRKRG